MACVIVNDACCLIDLRKARLLHAALSLPHRFVVPYPVRASELLEFTAQEWQLLDDSGVETFDLPPDAVSEALAIKAQRGRLSANDCFCLVATARHDNAVLLTGDQLLRKSAGEMGIEVHGVLWIIDLLQDAGWRPLELLVSALETWRGDPAVFLPAEEIDKRLRALRRLMS
ncbi:hypothetical protein SAE02_76740 [Skermanella aerolata]|uniref:Uncharacterized protein n=1 Tax=Skermanella aerolata TaxID=393310 RepID=A0A512E456_9PROT|nr:PIN domain-containing protein [Skermanella aerolata]KJB91314.1 hypothetical protein N826_31280 [Skermanella aerolata KACC 11604]GEO43526.1 hypothetical protein SAE02_76740 [Skermanella aerolata]